MPRLIIALGVFLVWAAAGEGPVSAEDPEGVDVDTSLLVLTAKWDPGRLRWEPGEPWRPVLTPLYYRGDTGYPASIPLRAAPRGDAEAVGEIGEDSRVEVVGGVSVWTPLDPILSTEKQYVVWLKVKGGELEGWVDQLPIFQEFVGGERACWGEVADLARVTFAEPYEPLYVGAGTSYPEVREEWGRGAKAGRHYRLLARCGDWYCLGRDWGGAWFPADTPGVTVEYLSFVWEPREDMIFCFYLPEGEEIDCVFYTFRSYFKWAHLAEEEPALKITTPGEEFEIAPKLARRYGFHETSQGDYEAALPRPVKREDITAITFAVGRGNGRIKCTFDPREAWANGAEE